MCLEISALFLKSWLFPDGCFKLLLCYSAIQVCLLVKADQSFGDKDPREIFIKKKKKSECFRKKREKKNQTNQNYPKKD